MFKIKMLEKETVPFVCEIMCEPNNVSALHTNTISLEEWKSIFERAEYDTDEENFIVYQNDTPCCWLKLMDCKTNTLLGFQCLLFPRDSSIRVLGNLL